MGDKHPRCYSMISPIMDTTERNAAHNLVTLAGSASPQLWRALMSYLELFEGKTQPLSFARAFSLAGETIALCPDNNSLIAALIETVDVLCPHARPPSWQPLTNHDHLKSALERADKT